MSLILPPEMLTLIQERGNIWVDFDEAIKNRNTLKSEGYKFNDIEFTDPISGPLSSSNLPSSELSAALYKLKDELRKIDGIESEIRRCQKNIQDEEARIRRNKTIAVIVAVIVVLIIACAALYGLNVLLNTGHL